MPPSCGLEATRSSLFIFAADFVFFLFRHQWSLFPSLPLLQVSNPGFPQASLQKFPADPFSQATSMLLLGPSFRSAKTTVPLQWLRMAQGVSILWVRDTLGVVPVWGGTLAWGPWSMLSSWAPSFPPSWLAYTLTWPPCCLSSPLCLSSPCGLLLPSATFLPTHKHTVSSPSAPVPSPKTSTQHLFFRPGSCNPPCNHFFQALFKPHTERSPWT